MAEAMADQPDAGLTPAQMAANDSHFQNIAGTALPQLQQILLQYPNPDLMDMRKFMPLDDPVMANIYAQVRGQWKTQWISAYLCHETVLVLLQRHDVFLDFWLAWQEWMMALRDDFIAHTAQTMTQYEANEAEQRARLNVTNAFYYCYHGLVALHYSHYHNPQQEVFDELKGIRLQYATVGATAANKLLALPAEIIHTVMEDLTIGHKVGFAGVHRQIHAAVKIAPKTKPRKFFKSTPGTADIPDSLFVNWAEHFNVRRPLQVSRATQMINYLVQVCSDKILEGNPYELLAIMPPVFTANLLAGPLATFPGATFEDKFAAQSQHLSEIYANHPTWTKVHRYLYYWNPLDLVDTDGHVLVEGALAGDLFDYLGTGHIHPFVNMQPNLAQQGPVNVADSFDPHKHWAARILVRVLSQFQRLEGHHNKRIVVMAAYMLETGCAMLATLDQDHLMAGSPYRAGGGHPFPARHWLMNVNVETGNYPMFHVIQPFHVFATATVATLQRPAITSRTQTDGLEALLLLMYVSCGLQMQIFAAVPAYSSLNTNVLSLLEQLLIDALHEPLEQQPESALAKYFGISNIESLVRFSDVTPEAYADTLIHGGERYRNPYLFVAALEFKKRVDPTVAAHGYHSIQGLQLEDVAQAMYMSQRMTNQEADYLRRNLPEDCAPSLLYCLHRLQHHNIPFDRMAWALHSVPRDMPLPHRSLDEFMTGTSDSYPDHIPMRNDFQSAMAFLLEHILRLEFNGKLAIMPPTLLSAREHDFKLSGHLNRCMLVHRFTRNTSNQLSNLQEQRKIGQLYNNILSRAKADWSPECVLNEEIVSENWSTSETMSAMKPSVDAVFIKRVDPAVTDNPQYSSQSLEAPAQQPDASTLLTSVLSGFDIKSLIRLNNRNILEAVNQLLWKTPVRYASDRLDDELEFPPHFLSREQDAAQNVTGIAFTTSTDATRFMYFNTMYESYNSSTPLVYCIVNRLWESLAWIYDMQDRRLSGDTSGFIFPVEHREHVRRTINLQQIPHNAPWHLIRRAFHDRSVGFSTVSANAFASRRYTFDNLSVDFYTPADDYAMEYFDLLISKYRMVSPKEVALMEEDARLYHYPTVVWGEDAEARREELRKIV